MNLRIEHETGFRELGSGSTFEIASGLALPGNQIPLRAELPNPFGRKGTPTSFDPRCLQMVCGSSAECACRAEIVLWRGRWWCLLH